MSGQGKDDQINRLYRFQAQRAGLQKQLDALRANPPCGTADNLLKHSLEIADLEKQIGQLNYPIQTLMEDLNFVK
jgi:hypothetical protein